MYTITIDKKVAMYGAIALSLLLAVFGVSNYLVSASTPDAGGQINACYQTTGGSLRIRDAANPADACSGEETPLSWEQKPLLPAAHVRVDMSGNLIASELKNITSYTPGTAAAAEANLGFNGYCLELPFAPSAQLTSDDYGGRMGDMVRMKNAYSSYNYLFDQSSADKYCPDEKYNVWLRTGDSSYGNVNYSVIFW